MKKLKDMLLNSDSTIGLIFDVDELLFDNRQEIFSAYESLLHVRNIFRYSNETFHGENLFNIINNLKEKYNIKDSIEVLVAERKVKYIKLLEESNSRIKSGVYKIFNHLYCNKQNIRLAYATSSEQVFTDIILEKVFKQCGIPQKDFFYTSTCWEPGMMIKKPDPDIYLETINKLGLSAKQCIAFEDSKSGVESALAAGLEVIYVPSSIHIEEFDDRVCVMKSLNDFLL